VAAQRIRLRDLPFRLLVLLVERAGRIVTRDEVRQRLWPDNTFVEFDNSLDVAVRKLGEALQDDANASRFVETIPWRGYRFIAPVTVPNSNHLASPDEPGQNALPVEKPPAAAPGVSARRIWRWLVPIFAILMVGLAIYKFQSA
jgi:DNA-binding winged helix-turn-helix (wHTH) protein